MVRRAEGTARSLVAKQEAERCHDGVDGAASGMRRPQGEERVVHSMQVLASLAQPPTPLPRREIANLLTCLVLQPGAAATRVCTPSARCPASPPSELPLGRCQSIDRLGKHAGELRWGRNRRKS